MAATSNILTINQPHMPDFTNPLGLLVLLLENNFVFPVAARVLPASEIQALGQEMRARRKDILQRLEASRLS